MNNYLEQLESILTKKFKKTGPFTLETSLIDDLGFDSLDVVEFVVEIEDAFGVVLNEDHLTRVKTIGDLINEINS